MKLLRGFERFRPARAPAFAAPASSWPAYFRAFSFVPRLLQITDSTDFAAEQFSKALYFRMRERARGDFVFLSRGPFICVRRTLDFPKADLERHCRESEMF